MRTQVHESAALSAARAQAASYESSLDLDQRKSLGQFFTGLHLSRVLAALSLRRRCVTAIDPMAGNGDLLDAVIERSMVVDRRLECVDAIEIDSATAGICRDRLAPWLTIMPQVKLQVHSNSAFDPRLIASLLPGGYDLVITNPPYVRYQTVACNGSNRETSYAIRGALMDVVNARTASRERQVWRELVRGYSGLSDLSVPSWLLAAMLVKPGGMLAVVAPATWRSRDYADVLQYMLARFFAVEAVVADRQPGWFSEVLVRTQLVVATRLPTPEASVPLKARRLGSTSTPWAEVDPSAGVQGSLVGAAFPVEDPEEAFASWLLQVPESSGEYRGIVVDIRGAESEAQDVLARCRTAPWFKRLEPAASAFPLFGDVSTSSRELAPHRLRDIVGQGQLNLVELSDLGIHVGQGLRTGCNGFFYVDLVEQATEQQARVRLSRMLGGGHTVVPFAAITPVLRRQADLGALGKGELPSGRVLDLRAFVLPEDHARVDEVSWLYQKMGLAPPSIMPEELAELVRKAAQTRHGLAHDGKYIPELSAVRTNVRASKGEKRPRAPRFWYMLPDFARRHLPDAFVARVNQHSPWVVANLEPPLLIDANFTTLWSDGDRLPPTAIVGLLNSSWSRACMEAVGTPMGGGALKLEATHLRRLPVPNLTDLQTGRLADLGTYLRVGELGPSEALDRVDHIVVQSLLQTLPGKHRIPAVIRRLREYAATAEEARQRR